MRYVSTRGGATPMSFQEAVMTGLARDGGLLLPEQVPDVADHLGGWGKLGYADLAHEVMRPYVDLPEAVLREILARSYAAFRHPETTPVVPVGDVFVLELFHGPTLSFKDVALQFLGHVFEYVLGATGRELNLLVATSGDTGSAAICGVRGRQGLRIFVMHPRGRVSRTQELQMTTVLDENVFNLAIEGTFDDCQRILKALFGDLAFRDRHALGAVNSINWARILAQIVYYFHAALRVQAQTGAPRVQFAVPTGNFGDIFAGFLACRMGLPVSRLILATNENDILARFFATGEYRVGPVHATISPSMDIQVASNFERYLYYRVGENPARAVERMAEFTATGRLRLEAPAGGGADGRIVAGTADTEATLATIRETHARHGYVLDPHTAVGVCVGRACRAPDEPLICLATAHPAKFSEAVRDATGEDLAHHPLLDRLLSLPTRCAALPASEAAVREYIQKHRVREFPCSP